MPSRRSSRSRTNLRTKTLPNVSKSRMVCSRNVCAYQVGKRHILSSHNFARRYPEWVSPLEAQKLAVGCAIYMLSRESHFGDKIVPCDRGITRNILEILSVKDRTCSFRRKHSAARCLLHAHWWLRNSRQSVADQYCRGIRNVTSLEWTKDGASVDRFGFPILSTLFWKSQLQWGFWVYTRRAKICFFRGEFHLRCDWSRVPVGTCLAAMIFQSRDVSLFWSWCKCTTRFMGNDGWCCSVLESSGNIKMVCEKSDWEVDRKNESWLYSLHLLCILAKKSWYGSYLIEKRGNMTILNKSGSFTDSCVETKTVIHRSYDILSSVSMWTVQITSIQKVEFVAVHRGLLSDSKWHGRNSWEEGWEWWLNSPALRCETRRHGDRGVVVGTRRKAFNQERSGKRRTIVSSISCLKICSRSLISNFNFFVY